MRWKTLESFGISKFGHAELNYGAGFGELLLIRLSLIGQISLQWQNFQLSPTTPNNQMFHFENPLVVKNSFVFRIINNGTGGNTNPTISLMVQQIHDCWLDGTIHRFG